jgi:hypothetical protein
MKKQKENIVWTAWSIWLRVLACIFILIIGWGILGPNFMSNSDSDLGVAAGGIITFLAPAFVIWILFGIYKHFKNKKR